MTDKQRILAEMDLLKQQLLFIETAERMSNPIQEEPVSINFEQELYKAFGQVKDFTLGMQIAKWFYDMGYDQAEKDLLEKVVKWLIENTHDYEGYEKPFVIFNIVETQKEMIDALKIAMKDE